MRLTGFTLIFTVCSVEGAARADLADRHAFVTSVTGGGDLGTWSDAGAATGLDAGDAICRKRAQDATLPNASSYRAWLSSSTVDAYCHVFGLSGTKADACGGFGPAASSMGPWLRMDETPFAAALADLLSPGNEVYQPVRFDELGHVIPDSPAAWVWTGSTEDGVAAASTCNDWVSGDAGDGALVGITSGVGREWTDFASPLGCNAANAHLLCLDAGRGTPLPKRRASGFIVFVTSVGGSGDLALWPDAATHTGIDAGDEICRRRAIAGALPDPSSFVAWLSDETVKATDRVTADGPFVRVDGFELAPSKSALLGAHPAIETGLNVTELESYYAEPPGWWQLGAWTGTSEDGTSAFANCENWTTSGNQGISGDSNEAQALWTMVSQASCGMTHPLYCFSNVEQLAWDNFERGDTSRWSLQHP